MTPYVYLNGEFVKEADARVSVYDGGWLHGAGLFETMRAENGRVFRLESHIDRLCSSASKLLSPIDRETLPDARVLAELLDRNGLKVARVRLTASAGSVLTESPEGSPRPTVCATAAPLTGYPREAYERGVTVVVSKFRQSPYDPVAGHKTTAYLPRLIGLREAQQAGCVEAIWFTTSNQLAEGSISNVFVVREGVLKTPPVDTPVLPGIARSVVLGLAAQCEMENRQVSLTIDDLLDGDEVFLTNTIMQIMPVIRVEKHDIGEGKVGSITKRLGEQYRELVRKECSAE